MHRYVAFLRGINVGGHTVRMDRLRLLFEELQLEGVSTFIASGNVLFSSPRGTDELERVIGDHLERSLGYGVEVFLRTMEELAAIATRSPFTPEEIGEATEYVCFLPAAPGDDVAATVAALSTGAHELRLRGRELYWLARGSVARADIDERALGRTLGMPMTMRNMNTVRRILARSGGDPSRNA